MSTRSRFLLLAASLAAGIAVGGCARAADRGPTGPAHVAPAPSAQLVTVALEGEHGGLLPSWFHFGSLFVEGSQGQAYAIRLTNNTGERVEAVLTVDGRDVISGQLGNFKKQRGYVLDPWTSIRVDGFRQSFEQVATFRFSGLQDSYTARQGTPQHAGVIGIAVFREKPQRQKKTGPIAVGPGPSPTPFPASGDDVSAGPAPSPTPFPGSASEGGAGRNAKASASAPSSAPPAEEVAADMSSEAEPSAAPSPVAGGDGGFAPPPEPRNELGTEYGESRYSSVHEVEFKRRKKRKPDEMFAVYYDSRRGLAARGVPVSRP